MLKEQIQRLVSTLQALTMQRVNALRLGRVREANQIQSVQGHIDVRIQQLERQLNASLHFNKR